MFKNIVFVTATVLILNACQSYSDEMVFYYDDEEAQPDVVPAPSGQVSSDELVIPTELREKKALTSAQSQSSDTPTQTNVLYSDDDAPVSLLTQNQSASQTTATSIPVTYGEKSDVPDKTEVLQNVFSFDVSDITPKVYAIAATRATNKMLDDTQRLYQQQDNKPKLLVLKAKKINPNLPDGLNYANKVIYDIIDGSQNYTLVSNLDDADFVLDVKVDAFPNQGVNSPVIVYLLTLQDKNGKEIDSWTQDIRQLQNDDKSWW